MNSYTIDKQNRTYTYYFFALFSILLTPLLNEQIEQLASHYEPLKLIQNFHLTGFVLFSLFISLFTYWGWKIKLLSGIPNLNGVWEGNYIRYVDGGTEMSALDSIKLFDSKPDENKIKILIEQNWLKMSLVYQADHSTSSSTIFDLKIENGKLYTLSWIFESKPRTSIGTTNKYGIGVSTASINVTESKDFIEGTYFTQKGKRGYFRVKLSKEKIVKKKKWYHLFGKSNSIFY